MAESVPALQRLSPRRGELIDREKIVSLTWNGKRLEGYDGDTVVSALYGAGVRVFSRSFKYRRSRGVMTADFHDPNTILQVGAEPNVRAGHRLAIDGMVVSSQATWPSLRTDVKSVMRAIGPFLGPGFYYKTFIRPRWLWPWYQSVLRRFSSGGTIAGAAPASSYDKRHAHPDVLVAGGGPAGMAAAIAAAAAGARVMLVEEEHGLGGHLRYGGAAQLASLDELKARVHGAGVEVLTDSVVFGRYDHNWIGIVQRSLPHVTERLIKARAGVLVVAPGLIERPYVFEGNDLPGVMLSGAARRLINLYAVSPGSRAVVLTANEAGDVAAADLESAGVDVAAVIDARRGESVVRARGRRALRSIELADGSAVETDLLVTATGWTAPTSLLNMSGAVPVFDESSSRFVPGDLPSDVMATGGIMGDGSLDQLVDHATAVGKEAARRAAVTAAARSAAIPAAIGARPREAAPEPLPDLTPHEHPAVFAASTDGFVDFSEDVTSKDLRSAAAEGYRSLELSKRYTTATMGPVQGKLEVINAAAVHAAAIGRTLAEMGTTTWRPPYAPVTLGALAGRNLEPVRYGPMQAFHEAAGAEPIVAGRWIRPNHYGDPEQEAVAVRSSVGIIDVSPLGKIDLRGRDVPRLLEIVYVNKWSKLAVGSVRYGIMCAEDGVVLDDGVTGRLADEHYMMTTTSSGAAGVYAWLDEWTQTMHPEWDVAITPMTDGYASINVAGPQSRRLMERVVSGIDVSAEAFPYMRVRTGSVAGVEDCFVWRIGFTGELSFEVHVPAGYGMHVWQALMEEGADLGGVPFGLEAQRVMRLEKGHFIVGQDTDGLTRAYATGLGDLVKLDKADFAGKPELVWEANRPDAMLVALQPANGAVVPPEASQIVAGDQLIGRVTSSRMSPALGRSICLGLVAEYAAAPGTTLAVKLPSGATVPCTVMEHHAHFDPKGSRLRG